VEHANFFETRATEYSKGATRGNWNDVWGSFDERKNASAANDSSIAALSAASGSDEADMFEAAGIAAE
jgi:ribonucleoside-diphosphate reductase beta chain